MRFLLCFLLFFAGRLMAQGPSAAIRIVQQDSEPVLLDEHTTVITLKRMTFKIQVLLDHLEGVYCFASFSDSLYRLPPSEPIPGFSGLPYLTMAEENFNKEKELLIHEAGWSYWFYNAELDWHRFNRKIVQLDTGRLVGFKTIKQVYLVEQGKERKIKDLQQPLYLFFTGVAETDAQGRPVRELFRRRVQINWINAD